MIFIGYLNDLNDITELNVMIILRSAIYNISVI